MQNTLCNKRILRDGDSMFYNFNFYSKTKDADGDIVYYSARKCYKGEYTEDCVVAVQNSKVVGWQT